jgi:hypothetical protein
VPLPPAQGAAEIFWRDAEQDLALAYVEGELAGRCQVELQDLSRDLSSIVQTSEFGLIKSVHFDGEFFDRLSAAVVDADDTFVSIRLIESGVGGGIIQGLSGAMLSLEGQIVGIAIDADQENTEVARFMRMDRIAGIISWELNSAEHPQNRSIAQSGANGGKGFRITGFQGGDNAEIVTLEAGGTAAAWTAPWTGKPIEFEITLSNDALVPINRIVMQTVLDGAVSPPRRFNIEVDRGQPGAAYWSSLVVPDMSPTGVFNMATGGTLGRRLRVTILDVWDADKNIRIDSLLVE